MPEVKRVFNVVYKKIFSVEGAAAIYIERELYLLAAGEGGCSATQLLM